MRIGVAGMALSDVDHFCGGGCVSRFFNSGGNVAGSSAPLNRIHSPQRRCVHQASQAVVRCTEHDIRRASSQDERHADDPESFPAWISDILKW